VSPSASHQRHRDTDLAELTLLAQLGKGQLDASGLAKPREDLQHVRLHEQRGGPRRPKWRVAQLTRLGIPRLLAEVYADRLDWHQIAQLFQSGCAVRLVIRIAR
jgi:hypothetical protein